MAVFRRSLPNASDGRPSEAERVLEASSLPPNQTGFSPSFSATTTTSSSADLDSAFQPVLPSIRARTATSRPTGQRFTPTGRLDCSALTIAANQMLRHQRSTSFKPVISEHLTERMRSMSIGSRTAPLKIDFVVVGGSISGLACAYALCQAGHNVRVLEKAPNLDQPSAGVRMPPNLTKILTSWGLGPQLEKLAWKCNRSTFYSMQSGETLGFVEWKEDILKEAGGDFLLMHFTDLRRMLYDLAIFAGASVSFSSTVVAACVDEDTSKPTVQLADGTLLTPDVVIGADGPKGVMRKVVNCAADDGVDTGQSFYTVMVPCEALRAVPELSQFPDLPEWPIWMGDNRSGLGYAVSNGKEFCMHLYWPDNKVNFEGGIGQDWNVLCPTSAIDMEGYESKICQIVKAAPFAIRTKYIVYKPLEDWVDETGCMLLVGEAAHAMLPCATHNASLAVEDAAVLGSLMSHLRSRDQIPMLLQAFHDIRSQRCEDTVLSELNNAGLCTISDEGQREGRDLSLKAAMAAAGDKDHRWTDQQLSEQWDEIGHVFGYDACDAAENWWVNWGAIGESNRAMPVHQPLALKFEVIETVASEPSSWTKVMG